MAYSPVIVEMSRAEFVWGDRMVNEKAVDQIGKALGDARSAQEQPPIDYRIRIQPLAIGMALPLPVVFDADVARGRP